MDDLRQQVVSEIQKLPANQRTNKSVKEHEAFGMWRDKKDIADVDAYIRNLRQGRLNDF